MQAIMAVPYFAAFAVTKAFLAEMAEMAERGSGNVCSIYSPSAWFPFVGSVAYTAARWALRGSPPRCGSRCAALE